LNQDIDGGYDEYTKRGMLQAADIQMTGPKSSDSLSEHPRYMLHWPSFVMDFGTEANAKTMYSWSRSKYYSSDGSATIPGYDTSVAWGEAGMGSLTVYSYYKKFFIKLDLEYFPEADTAVTMGKMFLDFFKSKIQ
jgi:hypothetical protein